jgi:hypothetical protein
VQEFNDTQCKDMEVGEQLKAARKALESFERYFESSQGVRTLTAWAGSGLHRRTDAGGRLDHIVMKLDVKAEKEAAEWISNQVISYPKNQR